MWVQEMFDGLAGEGQVIGATFFNRDQDKDYRVLIDGVLSQAVVDGYSHWSDPSAVSWVFDGAMDAWVLERATSVVFDDIFGSTFEADIVWFAEQGITTGCEPFRFCPEDPVTRAQIGDVPDASARLARGVDRLVLG